VAKNEFQHAEGKDFPPYDLYNYQVTAKHVDLHVSVQLDDQIHGAILEKLL